MTIYLAVDTDTGEVRAFLYRDDLERFANEHDYVYDYLEIEGSIFPIGFSELKNS